MLFVVRGECKKVLVRDIKWSWFLKGINVKFFNMFCEKKICYNKRSCWKGNFYKNIENSNVFEIWF